MVGEQELDIGGWEIKVEGWGVDDDKNVNNIKQRAHPCKN
jgi:hypothetical protein